jgi:protein-L-isoaspartate(D-aspartate) O-methyltransferase
MVLRVSERAESVIKSTLTVLSGLFLILATGCGDGGDRTSVSTTAPEVSPTSGSKMPSPGSPATAENVPSPVKGDSEALRSDRMAMVQRHIAGLGIKDPRVLEAMRAVPRHQFVPQDLVDRAYENRPLPIGFGQTISQPYIVALMTELLDLAPGEKVLEIGTGSGYQGAVLAKITDRVWSIEIIPELARSARSKLKDLGYPVSVRQADGYFGWPEHGPFDGIIVTAAPDHMPQPLIQQLAEGGRLVIPVGPTGSYQTLWRVTKQGGSIMSENITDVLFVPLVRQRD